MNVHPVRSVQVVGVVLLAGCASLFIWATVGSIAQGAIVPALLFGILTAALAGMVLSILLARIQVTESSVSRTTPWPRECDRNQIDRIESSGPSGSSQWRFVRQDGSTALAVSSLLFSADAIRTLAAYLGVRLIEP